MLPRTLKILWFASCQRLHYPGICCVSFLQIRGLHKTFKFNESQKYVNTFCMEDVHKVLYHPVFSHHFQCLSTLESSNSIKSFNQRQEITQEHLHKFYEEIKQLLNTNIHGLNEMCCYYFDGKGKSLRPVTTFLMSRACNFHQKSIRYVTNSQRKIALISEMIHIGSLIHDDVVDVSDIRRGKSSVNFICGDKKAVMAGNFIISRASQLLSTVDDVYVTSIITNIIDDLVRGEFMQQDNKDHFNHYLKKTFKKTASLIAHCCKAVAYLSKCDAKIIDAAYEYGKNIGIAFQLVDDLLDFVSTSDTLGKPAAADLRLGLATAPVFFACEKHPDLHEMITRRFDKPGDVEFALWAVATSDGVEETRMLAEQYCKYALDHLNQFTRSPETEALSHLSRSILERTR